MRLTLSIVILCSALPSAMPAQTRPDSVGAVAAVEQFQAALSAGDSARAMSLLSDDVLVMESGAIETRAQYLSGHLGADIKASRDRKDERIVLQARVVGDMAYVVTRTLRPANGVAGNTGSEGAELMVLSRSGPAWRIRAIHWSSRRRRA